MKKALFLVVFMVVGTIGFAQLDLGFKVGFNSSKITTDSFSHGIPGYSFGDFTDDVKMGYNIGGFARFGIKGRLFLQPEVYYSQKKGKSTVPVDIKEPKANGASTISQTLKLKSIDIPVLVGIELLDLKVASIKAFTGPVLSLNSGSSVDGGDGDYSLDSDDLKNSNWAYQLGAGVDFLNFTFDIRYEWGLSNLWEGLDDIKLNQKSNMLTFSLGFKIL